MKIKPNSKIMTVFLGTLTVFFVAISLFGSSKNNESDFLKKLKRLFADFTKRNQAEIVYLHLDKTFLKPSETLWFQAYVRDAQTLEPSTNSEIVRVEIINPKGNIEKELHLITKEATASGDFLIDENAPGGIYKIKAYTQWQKNFPETKIFEKEFQVQKVILPRVKLKLEFEREAYGAGDVVKAKFKGENLKNEPLTEREFSYKVALQGNEIFSGKDKTNAEGNAEPQFELPKNLESSDVLLTIILENNGFTESISRSVPVKLDNLSMEFFPEGGEYLQGFSSKIAFRVTDEYGKAADVAGFIEDDKGKKVAEFSSFHKGLGVFTFTPESGRNYSAKITQPTGINKNYDLPESLKAGYVLQMTKLTKDALEMKIFSTVEENMNVLAHVRENVFFSKSLKVLKGENCFEIPLEAAPIGVAHITLFDSKGIERAERLVFVNSHKQLNVKIKTDKERYQPREKVMLTVETTDERGVPVPAQLSLAVIDDKVLSFADDKQGHILSKILLESDLRGDIQEPNFYFDPKETKAPQALDLLMLTHGWRKFSWKNVLQPVFNFAHRAEKCVVTGIVISSSKQKPLKGARVYLSGSPNIETKTDSAGFFELRGIELYDAVTIVVESGKFSTSRTFYTYGSPVTIYLNDHDYDRYSLSRNDRAGSRPGRMKNAVRPLMAAEADDMGEGAAEEGLVVPAPAPENAVIEPFAPPLEAKPMKEEVVEIVANAQILDLRVEIAEGKKMNAKKKIAERDEFFGDIADDVDIDEEPKPDVFYYRARVFPSPDYKNAQSPDKRTDFRTTVFWKGDIKTDRKGKTSLEFYNSDDISAFRATVEGFGANGSLGRAESVFYTLKPFSMDVKIPVSMSMGDEIALPLVLTNNTEKVLDGTLTLVIPEAWQAKGQIPQNISIEAGKSKTIFLEFLVLNKVGRAKFAAKFAANGVSDAFEQEADILAKGFPSALSISGQEKTKTYAFDINSPVEGTVRAKLTVYPTTLSDVLAGIESILREPYGCFEQTSSSTYPNIMVLQYMRDFEVSKPEIAARAKTLIKKGYERLVSFETPEKGYEWFGGAPGHEALTAYGLLEFKDMQSVLPSVVDEKMISRTAEWLFNRRDGKGGFGRNERALDTYGRADADITNAYIVWSLTEAGYFNTEEEAKAVLALAEQSSDPYFLGLAANIAANFADASKTQANDKHPRYQKTAKEIWGKLAKLQGANGAFEGKRHSITYSTGQGLHAETTALAVLAALKIAPQDAKITADAVNYLISARSPFGGFGNTQSTIMVLKALNAYARYAKRTKEAGIVNVYVNNKKVAALSYDEGVQNELAVEGLEKYMNEGNNTVKIEYEDRVKNPLPYTLSVAWSTLLPNSSKNCKVNLETKLAAEEVKTGENVRLTAVLKNTTKDGLPMTLAILGIPGGLSAQPWQLKELQDKGVFDFYEVIGSDVVLYYRQMKPEETKTVHLDLKAEIKGTYESPASCAYLYYTAEDKVWVKANKISIKK